MEWYLTVWRRFSDFGGRSRRMEYWMFFLVNLGVELVLVLLQSALGIERALTLLYGIAIFIPALAVSIRRLHDTGRSGWWLLIGLIPFVGIIVLIVFFVLEGDRGPNEYGPDPKAEATPSPPSA